ncbi:HNH endonuclease signature motif containing protein [Candidatus Poriferisodalis sp.]|uniref:HNH endonuclease signature motif containing protein n=1 Tax=Candidatus Poriferisodalis sp. TaxID=3101277 RepID=UPI003B012923
MLAGWRAFDVFRDPAAAAPSSVPDALLAGAGNVVDFGSGPGGMCGCDDGAGRDGRLVNRWMPSQAPNQLVIVADIGVIDGTAPDGRCDVLGAGPVPKSILDDLSPDTRITGALFGGSGQPLWLGRSRRLASVAQQLAVAIRDRGCVLCGAPMHRCKYHHIDEWDADHGTTDIPNLAALCNVCHNSLHKGGQRLCRDPASGHWSAQKRTDGPRSRAGSDSHSTGEPSRLDGKTPRSSTAVGRGPP